MASVSLSSALLDIAKVLESVDELRVAVSLESLGALALLGLDVASSTTASALRGILTAPEVDASVAVALERFQL